MKQATLDEVQNDLSNYLQMAKQESIIIIKQGMPAGILISFDDPDDWWEELLLRDPRFQARIAQARANLRAGKGLTLEQMREKYDVTSTT